MAASAYATVEDLALYLRDVNLAANQQTLSFYLSSVSRWVDSKMGQYFYSDGYETKWFSSEGEALIDTGQHPFYSKLGSIAACTAAASTLTFTQQTGYGPAPQAGDQFSIDIAAAQETVTVASVSGSGPYTLTLSSPTTFAHAVSSNGFIPAATLQVQLAYFENQPQANWTPNLAGNGVRPPSNYFLWPGNPPPAGSSADPMQKKPFWGVNIAHIPLSGTTYLPASIPGYKTIAITANWGWPVVPDVIKDLTCKMTVRLWRSREAGFAQQLASTETGIVSLLNKLDDVDRMLLAASEYRNVYL